jgi:parallel beta-helix repeat protein
MLDSPGEWAAVDDRLYLWAPDGQSPEGRRVWATPHARGINGQSTAPDGQYPNDYAAPGGKGINADQSSDITIENVRIFSAATGISADRSANLKVLNSLIEDSTNDGIFIYGSNGLVFDRTDVTNSGNNGINGYFGTTNATIKYSTISNSGTIGPDKPTDAGIMIGRGENNVIDHVRVLNSGYHGISVLQGFGTLVTDSEVNTACVRLTDCGGIYTGSPEKFRLNLRIVGNTVTNVRGLDGGIEGYAIYLDDSANGVTVTGNTISNSTVGIFLHNAFDTAITGNTVTSSEVIHLKIVRDNNHTVDKNQITDNTFNTTNREQTFNLSSGTDEQIRGFATFDRNTYTYTGGTPNPFARTWDGISNAVDRDYGQWKSWTGQDANSTMNGAP